jgi:hypothetical protein
MRVAVALILLLPALIYAECAEWIRCPYLAPVDTPNLRYVSIDDARLPFGWKEIEVAGNQAVVCMDQIVSARVLNDTSCTRINRMTIDTFLVPPEIPFFDLESQTIKFHDGQEGRNRITRPFEQRSIRRRIKDSALDSGILRGPER